jgi:N-acetyl-anhydromuramyl-L-alanine amidase AmpD
MKLSSLLTACLALSTVAATARTPDLPSCDVWQQACHYTNSDREGTYNINRVVIHKTQGGTAAGAASWFANCSSGGSAHFSFDKSNGYCYQSVLEADVAWHAGYSSTNNASVGIEHSGWVNNNDTSTACYNESALETKSCVTYYAVPANRSYVIGHSEVPGCSSTAGGTNCHTDPGPHWNWAYYMGQVGSTTTPPPPTLPTITIDNASAGFSVVGTWSSGSSAADKYGADYRFHSTVAASEPASWSAGIGTAGTYKVQAWWAAGANRSAAAPYILPNGATVAKNQQTAGGAWNTLGTIGLSGTAVTKLSTWASTGYIVVADAVRYTP